MRIYNNGLDYIWDELYIIERGIGLLLQRFKGREASDDSPFAMRRLVVTPDDIKRSMDEGGRSLTDEALAAFRTERAAAEREHADIVTESIRSGVVLPLAFLSWRLQLTVWERRCIMLCLANEIDPRYESWFGYLNDDVTLRVPTAGLALQLLCDHPEEFIEARMLLTDGAKLSRYLLTAREASSGSLRSDLRMPLKLDKRITSFLLGTETLDARLGGFVTRVDESQPLEPLLFGEELQERLLAAVERERELNSYLAAAGDSLSAPFLQLSGPAGAGKKLQAKHLAQALRQPLLIVRLDRLYADAGEASAHLAGIVREALITGAILAFEDVIPSAAPADEERRAGMLRLLSAALADYGRMARQPVILWLNRAELRREQLPLPPEAALLNGSIEVPEADVRLQLWRDAAAGLEDAESGVTGGDALLIQLADKYKFTPGQIAGTHSQAQRLAALEQRAQAEIEDYAAASRMQVQHKLSELAEKRQPARSWNDLILPEEPMLQLKEACSRFTHSETVFQRWGFGRKLPYGRGLSMLFAGPPGTGKTMAAEIVAGELGLELYRIDLSRVVSKYIGETEKNLRELFAEAENSGSILFFDEGDSLFGKRTEVKDSHDRFANMEAAYLLQRIESFDGVSILATNLMQNMDEAFMRRMQTIIKFPFPDALDRERIFRSLLPEEAPLDDDLDLPFLASRVEVAGGHIKNIVLSAAFLAAGEASPIGMRHMVRGARQELHKMGKIIVKEAFDPYI